VVILVVAGAACGSEAPDDETALTTLSATGAAQAADGVRYRDVADLTFGHVPPEFAADEPTALRGSGAELAPMLDRWSLFAAPPTLDPGASYLVVWGATPYPLRLADDTADDPLAIVAERPGDGCMTIAAVTWGGLLLEVVKPAGRDPAAALAPGITVDEETIDCE
jgi:hypothetical protein